MSLGRRFPRTQLLAADEVGLVVLRALWAAWDVSDRWRFFDGADYVLSPEFWAFGAATAVSLEALALMALDWPLVPLGVAMLMAGLGAMGEALIGFGRDSQRSAALFTNSETLGLIAIARFGATALLLWPIFAGMSHFRLDVLMVQRSHPPMVSSDPPRFWMGLLVGLPIWLCVRLSTDAAMQHLRVWSVSGAEVSGPVPNDGSENQG